MRITATDRPSHSAPRPGRSHAGCSGRCFHAPPPVRTSGSPGSRRSRTGPSTSGSRPALRCGPAGSSPYATCAHRRRTFPQPFSGDLRLTVGPRGMNAAAPRLTRERPSRHGTMASATTQEAPPVTVTETPSSARLPLLLLGRGADPQSERGVECPGDLPAASDPGLVDRARRARAALGERAFVLGHHYQRDEVIVFCGVHFMAESADLLTAEHQQVVLPDLAAGCSMADMARLVQVEEAWERLADAGAADVTVPVTYMNSSADIKAFCGRNGGTVCT